MDTYNLLYQRDTKRYFMSLDTISPDDIKNDIELVGTDLKRFNVIYFDDSYDIIYCSLYSYVVYHLSQNDASYHDISIDDMPWQMGELSDHNPIALYKGNEIKIENELN